MEDIDILAAITAFSHATTESNKDKLQIVTASVDRIDMLQPIQSDKDIKMCGMVTYVGKSSMEASLELWSLNVAAPPIGEEKDGIAGASIPTDGTLILKAKFIMVNIVNFWLL